MCFDENAMSNSTWQWACSSGVTCTFVPVWWVGSHALPSPHRWYLHHMPTTAAAAAPINTVQIQKALQATTPTSTPPSFQARKEGTLDDIVLCLEAREELLKKIIPHKYTMEACLAAAKVPSKGTAKGAAAAPGQVRHPALPCWMCSCAVRY
jgi:hypothetical protein